MINETRKNKGPWLHRFLVWLFSIALTILFYWLLGFILSDIGTLPGPSYLEVEKQFLDGELVRQREEVTAQIAALKRKIGDQQERQKILRDSTSSSQQTMNQLLEFQRINLQKDIKPSPAEQEALAESQNLFLANQKRYQALNEDIAQLSEEQRSLENRKREIEATLESQRGPARDEFQRLKRKHDIQTACLKLLALIPLLLVALFFFLKKRSTLYAPILYAAGIALILKVGVVMHEYFPERYFKYILLLAALAIAIRILVYLLQMVAFPRKDWLLKQYREAYEKFLCPICGYPIRRGPLRYALWSRRTIRRQVLTEPSANPQAEETYTCPACGAMVFEQCESCHSVRHSFLPFCEKCGAEKQRV